MGNINWNKGGHIAQRQHTLDEKLKYMEREDRLLRLIFRARVRLKMNPCYETRERYFSLCSLLGQTKAAYDGGRFVLYDDPVSDTMNDCYFDMNEFTDDEYDYVDTICCHNNGMMPVLRGTKL